MSDNKRWFEFEEVLKESTVNQNYSQFVTIIKAMRTIESSQRDEEFIIKLIEWCADNLPFQSYRSDVIKNQLWELLEH